MNLFKSLTMPKKTEGEDTLGFFNFPFVAKLQKIEGEPFGQKKIEKKSHSTEKNLKGDPLVSLVLYVTRETFFVQFLGPTGTIWRLLKSLLKKH